MTALTEAELATRAGVGVEIVRRLATLGIITPSAPHSYSAGDLPRVRLALALEGSGVLLEDLARGIDSGALSLAFAEFTMAEPVGLLELNHRDLVASLALPAELSERFQSAIGFPASGDDEPVREDDAEIFGLLARSLAAGVSPETAVRAVRVFVDHLRAIVAFERELFVGDVEAPLLGAGRSEQEVLELTATRRIQLQRLGDRLLLLLHHRHLEEAVFQNVIEHVERVLEQSGIARRRETVPPAIAFLDLTGYTSLTEEFGDERAAAMAQRLVERVRDVSIRHGGRPVKFLGDGVMFHFGNAAFAVLCALELVEAVPAAGLPAARVGISSGPVVQRDGDYFGRTVNIASRVVDHAAPGEVWVTEDVERDAGGLPGVGYEEVGPTLLKGVAQPLPLRRVIRLSD